MFEHHDPRIKYASSLERNQRVCNKANTFGMAVRLKTTLPNTIHRRTSARRRIRHVRCVFLRIFYVISTTVFAADTVVAPAVHSAKNDTLSIYDHIKQIRSVPIHSPLYHFHSRKCSLIPSTRVCGFIGVHLANKTAPVYLK